MRNRFLNPAGRANHDHEEAERRCLDPDKWFNNVEVVTAEKVDIETTNYVPNIYKYYVSYRLTLDMHQRIEKAGQSHECHCR